MTAKENTTRKTWSAVRRAGAASRSGLVGAAKVGGVGLVLGALALVPAGPAGAAAQTAAVGQLALFTNPDFTGAVFRINYNACTVSRALSGTVASFDNAPSAGCRVTLTRGASTMTLCVGRNQIPLAFRESPTVRIVAGSAALCPF